MESELKKRIGTAAIGAAIFLTLVLVGGVFGSFIAFTLLCALMANEYAQMVFGKMPDRMIFDRMRGALMIFCGSFPFWVFVSPGSKLGLLILGFLGAYAFALIRVWHTGINVLSEKQLRNVFRDAALWCFGLVYVGLFPSYFLLIRGGAKGLHWIMVFLLIHWMTDIGAYFGGKKWGQTKLFPEVSPKKSVEGLYCGIGAALLAVILYKILLFSSMSWAAAVILPIVVGVLAQVGDLAESLLKRAYGVKDSGTLLPGHGGILDRFDGIVFTLPIMYTGMQLF